MTQRIAILNPDGTAVVGGVKCKLVPVEPTKEWCMAYLEANKEYWLIQDAQALPPLKWRNGTPAEATRYAYERAMLSAAAIDLSGLPRVPERLPVMQHDPLLISSGHAMWNACLDAIGVPK